MEPIKLQTPLTVEDTARLRAGQTCLLSGIIYTARDS
ncbi:MAG TPA: TRZ/ATZ family protein, partial [Firmicutes bacterium]|nr:TRZ/ATZ family protein [Bacillota bacterium]